MTTVSDETPDVVPAEPSDGGQADGAHSDDAPAVGDPEVIDPATTDPEALDDEAIEAEAAAELDPDAESAEIVDAPEEPVTVVVPQLDPTDTTWWKSAVFYQIYPRSFCDANGDGVGDLAGVIGKLGYLELLGIDAIWLSPIMTSPMADHGYDVSDPRDIDPLFGDLATFDALIAEAHEREIRVTMDLVPNHTSDRHEWFQAALAAGPGSPERDRYIFRDGRGENGDEPPNNWHSIFGGPSWTRVTEADGSPGQWYLHIFAAEQPDLNWENPEVFDDLEKTLRFWLDRGVDGFRIDVAHGMAKPADLPDMDLTNTALLSNDDDDPRFNNYAVHDIHRKIRKVLDEYPGAANVGEIWVNDNERFAEYLRPDELHLGFNFRLAKAPSSPRRSGRPSRTPSTRCCRCRGRPRGPCPTTTSNERSRATPRRPGDRRTRSRTRDASCAGDARRRDGPARIDIPLQRFRTRAAQRRRSARGSPPGSGVGEVGSHRTRPRRMPGPVAVAGHRAPFGFSTSADTWLPMPESWRSLTAEAQLEDVGSMLSLYRAAIELRYNRPEFAGDSIDWYESPEGCLAFRRSEGFLICALNAGDVPVPLPPGELLLISSPLVDGMLAPDAAAWLV
ncbi:alpha-glucosidase [Gordonia westfalica]|uniref:Alpha-glucosidase n=1 Tax=Gordonia westfalica TaxID=158898 RepID=A0A1H2I727_9ACTN|nr:alpha-glucosidase [Gordonia westfalica]